MTAVGIAQLFLAKVKNSGIPVSAAYLFGSHAKGTAKQYSDIDICIVSPKLGKDPIAEMVILRKIAHTVDSRIEPIPLSPADLNDQFSTLIAQIQKYGRPIVPLS